MLAIFNLNDTTYGTLTNAINPVDIELRYFSLTEYEQIIQNLDLTILPTATVYGEWHDKQCVIKKEGEEVEVTFYNQDNQDDKVKNYGYNNVHLTSVSGNIRLSPIFDKTLIKELKIARAWIDDANDDIYEDVDEENEEEDEDEDIMSSYTCVYIKNKPSFFIDHHTWIQFERVSISNDDRYIVLVWSRYIAVYDIIKKCCIYMCDCEANGIIAEDIECGFDNIISCESHKKGITVTYEVQDLECDVKKHTIIFF